MYTIYMGAILFLPYYFTWHYSKALRNSAAITKDFIWFLWHFFSVGLNFKTILSPWRRMQETQERRFDIEAFFSTFIINTIMRVVGAFIRLIFILLGVVSIIVL